MVFGQYSLSSVKKAIQDPTLLLREIRRVYQQSALHINSKMIYTINKTNSVDYMEMDWDNMIILDAARYDMFSECDYPEGDLSPIHSSGSESWEFMQTQFVGRQLHDTVYITANPHAYKIPDGTFHTIVNLLDEGWDQETQTVLPETIIKSTLSALEKYPNKRIISHWMQPHFPFIGTTGREIDHKGIEYNLSNDEKSGFENPWTRLNLGDSSNKKNVIKAYRENHEIAIEDVKQLVEKMDGKTVITADHGNLIGEWLFPIPTPQYGHPRGLHKSELITVPWLEIKSETRRSITEGEGEEKSTIEDDIIKDRLSAMGYVK